MKRTHKLLSVLLILAMVFSMVPMTAMATEDPEVIVTHDVDEIRELLRQDGDVSIKLDADAEKKLTAYSDFENYQTDSWNSQYVWTKLGSGNKTIDLNGYRLYVYDQSARSLGSLEWMDFRYIQGALLMEIPEGAALTVNDSSGGGMIWMDAEMPDKSEIEGSDLLMERNIFAVTGGNLTVNGGEIHAGRSKEIYAQAALKHDKDYRPIYDFTGYFYDHLYGYATWFLSGTAITAESGNVTINGGDIWGRGWDNWSLISRVPNQPNGADDHRDRCAALRVHGGQVTINSGNFYGRSDADAVQVYDPEYLTVDAGSFDVGTNSWLVIPGVDLGGVSDSINDIFIHDSVFVVHEGYVGSFGVPNECINDQSVKVVKGNTMTLSKNSIDPYKIVDEVNIYINSPLADETPAEEVYNVPDGCTVESVTWYHNGSKVDNPEDTFFVEGDSYYVKIALSVDIGAGTKFKNNLTSVSINGKETELYRADEENIVLTLYFGACIAALEELEFEVIEPEEGQYANSWVDTSEYELYAPIGGYSNYGDYRTWYVSDDGSDWTEMDSEAVFEAGKYYRFSFEVHTGEGQEFALDGNLDPAVSATVNGENATVSEVYEQDPSEHIAVTVDFGKCPALISQVELTVTAPKEGETISYEVGCVHDTYYALGNNSNYTTYRQWLESDTGYDGWTKMTPGDSFEADKYYKFVTDIYTQNGYEFPTYDNGTSIVPGVYAYVNNYAANVSKGYEQDPARYITVEYFFGICNDEVVELIGITGITAPVPGQKPSYTAGVQGIGYHVDTDKNESEEIYWKNPVEYWPYIKNGIGWYDVTASDWVYDHQTFIAGHDYSVTVYVVPDNDYTFLYESGYKYPTGTLNGNAAEVVQEWTTATESRVYYTFQWAPITVTELNITGLDAPVVGEHPDVTVSLGEGNDALYTATVSWYVYEGNGTYGAQVLEDETFAVETPYRAEIIIRPNKTAQNADVCNFAVTENAVKLNGILPSEVWPGPKSIYIYHDFRNASAGAPEAPGGVTVTGTVQASNTELKPTVKLYAASDTAHETALYIAEVGTAVSISGQGSWSFSISDVAAGTYDLVITKDGHQDSVQQITVSNANKNMGVITLSVLATSTWSGDSCTVTLEVFEEGVSVMVASYEDGKLVKVEHLTVDDPTAILTGDNVKVFFLDDDTYAPIRKAMEMIKT